MEKPEATIIIPAYNEENTITKIVDKIEELFSERDIEIIIINDKSTDSTKELCEKLVQKHNNINLINNEKNQGKTKNIVTSMPSAKSDILAFIDADYQYDPEDLPAIIEKVKQGYDLCSGIRQNRQDNLYRKFMSKGFNVFNNIMFGIKIQDINCGLKAFKKEILNQVQLEYLDAKWFIDTELLAKAYRQKLNMTEIPIRHHARTEGDSKVVALKLAYETITYGILLKLKFLMK